MERREFTKLTAAGALSAGFPSTAEAQASYAGLGRPPMKWGVKHSMQIGDLRPETLQLAKQLGMEYVNIWSSPDKYKDIVRTVETAGLQVAKIGNGGVHNQAAIVLGLPGRDEKIEEFKRNLRALAAAGIKTQLYAHMANGVWRTAPETNRGGAIGTAFEEGRPATAGGSSHNGAFERAYSEDELWKNWEYFVKQIVPVAEETGVRIGVHTDDPPGLTFPQRARALAALP